LFLSENVGYQIDGNFNTDITGELVDTLNRFENAPSFQKYILTFESIMLKNKIIFSSASVSVYKNFEKIWSISLNSPQNNMVGQNIILKKVKR